MEGKKDVDRAFKDLGVYGADWKAISVRYNPTEGNEDIAKEFKEFCKRHSDDGYLQGISKLLMLYKLSFHLQEQLDVVYDELEALKADVKVLKEGKVIPVEQPKPQEFKTFG